MVPKFFISFAIESNSSGYVTETVTFWGNRTDDVIAFCLYLINFSFAVPEYFWFDRFLMF